MRKRSNAPPADDEGHRDQDYLLRALLIVGGIVLASMALVMWSDTGDGPTTQVTEVTEPSPSGGSTPSSRVVKTTDTISPGVTKETTKTFAPVGTTTKTTTTEGPSTSRRSEAVTLALLGIGLLLLLLGVFWLKLQSITAAGITLTFQSTEKSVDAVKELVSGLDKRVARRATKDALTKTNSKLAEVAARVEALEQGRPLGEIAPDVDEYVLAQPDLVEMMVHVDAEDPDEERELQTLRQKADQAVTDLKRRVDELPAFRRR